MRKDTKLLYYSAMLSALLAVACIAFQILPMLAIWIGMLYVTQAISGISFIPPDMPIDIAETLSLEMFAIAFIMMCEGIFAWLIWEKGVGKIVKRVKQQ